MVYCGPGTSITFLTYVISDRTGDRLVAGYLARPSFLAPVPGCEES
jgi:hypothetical protein